MYNEGEQSFRLTYKKIIYLASSIGVKKIYGLRHKIEPESPDEENLTHEWELIKKGLFEKEILKQKNDKIVMNSNIYEMLQTISNPRLFFVARSKEDFIDISRNYYFSNHLSVKLEYDTVNQSAYMITRYDNPELLKESLQNFFTFYSKSFEHTDDSICLGIEELKKFLQSVTDNDQEQQTDILYQKGLDTEYIKDIVKALEEKSSLRTMLVISFGNSGQSVVKEYIIYGGGTYLWQIEFRGSKAYITSISNEIISYKMTVLSDVLFYI